MNENINCNEDKVSVIIPMFMVEKFIATAINSLIHQTYSNIEIICVDDASKDGSYNVVKNMLFEHKNIKLIRNIDDYGKIAAINQGLESARNTGLNNASGKFVLFLDADDTLDQNTILNVVGYANKTMADIVLFDYSAIINGKEVPIQTDLKEGLYTTRQLVSHFLDDLPWNSISCVGTKLYRREMILNNNIKFKKKYKYNEDCAFAVETLLVAKSVYYLNQPFYKYLIRENSSLMSSYRENMFQTNIKVIELFGKLLEKHGYYEQKKSLFYDRIVSLIIDSLVNEVKYGDKNSTEKTIEIIKQHKITSKIIEYSIGNYPLYDWKRIVLIMIDKNSKYLYALLKIRKICKTKNKIQKVHVLFWSNVVHLMYGCGNIHKNDNVVYMFHNVSSDVTNPYLYNSNYMSFEKFIKNEMTIRKPINLNRSLDNDVKKAFAVTFDDGYDGVYNYAYPILNRYNIPFTIFVTVEYLDKQNYLTSEQMLEMLKNCNCSVQCHTDSHPKLRDCKDLYNEVIVSKKQLEKKIGKTITAFAYPYGSVSACDLKSIHYVKKAGYMMAFSSIDGSLNFVSKKFKHFLPRIDGDYIVQKCENINMRIQ